MLGAADEDGQEILVVSAAEAEEGRGGKNERLKTGYHEQPRPHATDGGHKPVQH